MDNFPWRFGAFCQLAKGRKQTYTISTSGLLNAVSHLRLAKELNMATVVTVPYLYLFASVIP